MLDFERKWGYDMVTITIAGEKKQYPVGTTYEKIAEEYQAQYDGLIGLVAVNGKIKELFKQAKKDCELKFFTLKDDVGHKTYVRTATMLFLKAVSDVFGHDIAQEARVEFAVGNGSYISTNGRVEPSDENAKRLVARMRSFRRRLCRL